MASREDAGHEGRRLSRFPGGRRAPSPVPFPFMGGRLTPGPPPFPLPRTLLHRGGFQPSRQEDSSLPVNLDEGTPCTGPWDERMEFRA
jgi:hypothetical protein